MLDVLIPIGSGVLGAGVILAVWIAMWRLHKTPVAPPKKPPHEHVYTTFRADGWHCEKCDRVKRKGR